ncbi:MAG: FAD-dependent oxidoreductase, partial [Actinomycetia bacterium]|nr:FAD-dependent oxidoreductase [Actinomycetes bacterium]
MSEPTVDVSYDVVVVGGGASGKSAALAAAQGGLSVAILEKLPQTGGSSVYAEGTAAFESSEQKARGVPAPGKHFPTREEGFRRYTDYSHHRANPDVVRMQVENTAETIDIYKSLGITYTDVNIYAYDQPYELYTFHRPEGLGERCQEVLLKAAEDAGVEVFVSTPAKELIMEDGKVAGVVAEDSDGNTLRIGAKAVVLAAGGFGNNPDLVEKYSWLSAVAHDTYQCVPTANTGDGLTMALSAGADTSSLGSLMVIACARGKMLTAHSSG